MSKVFSLNKIPFPQNSVTLAGGYFDLLHAGHMKFLDKCRKIANPLVVAVLSDELAKRKSPSGPIIEEHDRMYMLSQLESVDYVFLKNFSYSHKNGNILRRIRPKVVVFSSGEKVDKSEQAEINFIGANFPEIKVKFIPRQRVDISTTLYIERIFNRGFVDKTGEKEIYLKDAKGAYRYLKKIARNSNARLKTAAVIVSEPDGKVSASGVNYHPPIKGKVRHRNKDMFEYREGLPRPTHAEVDALIKLLGAGRGKIDSSLIIYTLSMPCAGCAELLRRAGFKKVYYFEDFDNNFGELVLKRAGVEIKKVNSNQKKAKTPS